MNLGQSQVGMLEMSFFGARPVRELVQDNFDDLDVGLVNLSDS